MVQLLGTTSETSETLLELANQGWPEAQWEVAEGYAEGKNGFAKNEDLARFFEVYFKWKNIQLAKASGNLNHMKDLPNFGVEDDDVNEVVTDGVAAADD